MSRDDDPRRALLGGLGGLWIGSLLTLTLVGASPATGWKANRALDAIERGETAVAVRTLERIAEEHPGNAGAWLRAGRALVADGRAREGADGLARAASLDPTSNVTRYEWANALMMAWLDDEADRVLQGLLERDPGHGDGLFLAAALAAGRGDVTGAAERLAAALAAGCTDPERIRFEPRFDVVRADPRFVAVARDGRFAPAFAGDGS